MRLLFSWRGGPGVFLLLGGVFVLVALIMVVIFANTASQLQRYQAGSCTITAKQLLQEEQQETHSSNGHTYTTLETVYRPDFQFVVHTMNGLSYKAEGYDALGTSSSDQSGQQAIVEQYRVGQSYPCWYNPTNPAQAVLTRQFDWFIFLIPAVFLIVGGVFVIVGIILVRKRYPK